MVTIDSACFSFTDKSSARISRERNMPRTRSRTCVSDPPRVVLGHGSTESHGRIQKIVALCSEALWKRCLM